MGYETIQLPFEKDIFLYGMEIAVKTSRDNIAELYEIIHEGDLVILIREPENPYDEYAVRIDVATDFVPGYYPSSTNRGEKKMMLGYVSRSHNKILARLMDAGKLLYGTVSRKEIIFDYYWIDILIFMKD